MGCPPAPEASARVTGVDETDCLLGGFGDVPSLSTDGDELILRAGHALLVLYGVLPRLPPCVRTLA